uniref:NEDD8-activating enzyme E1 catalytic subunit n=1 Tax=Chromera velia CCMP2878 TaxID=1169474 RepID=A0A0G4H9V6_9ALVE|mmetsp:Transcript_47476/g.93602  ORF Transcript_47476/g.93602 Transcript_47476/m.93602 type:complete len:438 (+) Transcript_47476:293-1606(+)|eukprot:Cvel_25396.t1-p1 / transcript=Cvel_25396.t1 / gene=Cvel_25396 / organism=Chromera_velia_CCMP2878 / gene_product=NEDD8-activating enzyme E1 catalytic subunit, putative / transcript_product=NEDD8-activating enzyme E1 catalytic subunit, putative / location=Cvel_scaffold2872:1047-8433(-) / protein_length=437 / sequence_SO=supercontig / SO=protein_coding / is_pseudo=false
MEAEPATSSWNASAWKSMSNLLYRGSDYADPDFEGLKGVQTGEWLNSQRVLVIGAGGLGCEILKDLALSGYRDVHVIDMDHIDVTNLNRQFLFREKDVGKSKAEVASAFINQRCGHLGINVTAHHGKIQDKDMDFYAGFNAIIAGLDNVDARRWLNCTLYGMVESGSPAIPLIDGGTEGFRGQARVIVPGVTSCFECSLDSFPPQVNFPMCTIAETPRLPEHCIEYALVVIWPNEFKERKPDNDSAEDMQWIFKKAEERARNFGIEGVTYQLTMGVVKRIIPAIASTNALISAALVSECTKALTYCGKVLNSYMMYMGKDSVYINTFEYAKNPSCLVCAKDAAIPLEAPGSQTLQDFMDSLKTEPRLQLARPSMSCADAVVFQQAPKPIRVLHEYKLSKTLNELVEENVLKAGVSVLSVTDPKLPGSNVTIELKILE